MIQHSQSPMASDVIQHLLSLIEQSDDVFWVRNADYSEQLYISPAYERVWGLSCQSLYDNPGSWIETLVEADRKKLKADMGKRRAQVLPGEVFYESYRIVAGKGGAAPIATDTFAINHASQGMRWIEDQAFAIFDDQDNHIGFAGIARDITEKVQREQALIEAHNKAEENYRAKMAFIDSVRHDMRTPLKGIIGASNVISIEAKAAQAAYAELSTMINQAGTELLGMWDAFFDLIDEENQGFQEQPRPFSLQKVLHHVETLFRPSLTLKQPDLEYKLTVDPALPACLLGGRDHLARLLFNLLDNAVKFTEKGQIHLSLSRSVGSSEKQTILKISVTDTGIGIPANQQEKIFEDLTRLHPSYEGRYAGMGLGLYMAKRWVQAMEGEIYVKSTEGEGSHFIVAIPFAHPLLAIEEYSPVIEVK